MPLTIGMKNASDKGFSEEEIEVAHGFDFGLLCMHAGVGDIGEKEFPLNITITPEEAHERFALTMQLFGWEEDSFMYTWLSDLENIKRLAENDWTCNVNNETTEHFLHKMRNLSLSRQLEDEKFTHLKSNIGEMSADTVCEQQEAARTIIGSLLNGTVRMGNGDKQWYIDTLIEAFGVWEWRGPFDLEKPFYDGKYLCYADGTLYLSSTPQEDE